MHQAVDEFQLLLAGVAGDVQPLELVIDDVRALTVQLVDDLANGLFVAGDGRGRDDDAVARLNLHLPVL